MLDFPGHAEVAPNASSDRMAAARRPSLGFVVTRAILAAFALGGLVLLGPPMGAVWSPAVAVTLFVGIVLAAAFPSRAYLIAGLCGVAVLLQWTALRTALYHLALIVGTFFFRRRPRLLVGFLVLGVILIPKELFRRYYHQPYWHDWVNQYLLAHLFLVVLVWWSTDRRGRANETSFSAWLCLLLFPGHPINPMVFSPTDLWRPRVALSRDILNSLLIVAVKGFALWAIALLWPQGQLAQRSATDLLTAPLASVWATVGLSYLVCALLLSGTADVSVLLGRLFGWPLPHPFRWALLAWNPVELWRRWAIYNRKVLLQLVYFPLGGADRHRILNVMLTFAASGLVLHSGWLGSRYWEVGPGGWRDQTIYFLLQGLAVSGCLLYWSWRGKSPAADRELRFSVSRIFGVIATQALSAWLHILVLAPGLSFAERVRLMGRCFGIE